MADLTTIILTKNEEKNIARCLKAVKPISKRIIVVDSGSTDRTLDIATEFGADVMMHKLSPFYYAEQFLYAMEKGGITTKWVLRLDADEEFTPEAAAELEQLMAENADTDVNGIVVRFTVNFMGRDLKHGGVYPFRKLLCFKYGKGNIENRKMDEHIVLFEGRSVEMKNDSIHHAYTDLTSWISKHNSYATREAEDYFAFAQGSSSGADSLDGTASGKRKLKFGLYYKLPSGLRTWAYYMYRLIIKGGFLDGREGRIYAFMQAFWYRRLVDAKIYEKEKQ